MSRVIDTTNLTKVFDKYGLNGLFMYGERLLHSNPELYETLESKMKYKHSIETLQPNGLTESVMQRGPHWGPSGEPPYMTNRPNAIGCPTGLYGSDEALIGLLEHIIHTIAKLLEETMVYREFIELQEMPMFRTLLGGLVADVIKRDIDGFNEKLKPENWKQAYPAYTKDNKNIEGRDDE